MLDVGLTGGIGSGKSLVAEVFTHLGIPVFNADARAKELMTTHKLMNEIKSQFGEEAYEGGRLNRSFLANIVFEDAQKLEVLNNIVHPALWEDYKVWFSKQKGPYAVREVAILFESGSYTTCDKVITVTAPEELRIERVMKRDKTSRDAVLARINNQWTEDKKVKLSDFVITNDEQEMLLPQVIEIHKKLISGKF